MERQASHCHSYLAKMVTKSPVLFFFLFAELPSRIYDLADEQETIPHCNIEVNMPTSISVLSPDLPHPIQFNLFDHVRVSLKLRKSHAHRHLVYMVLIDMDHTEIRSSQPSQIARMSNTEMMESIHDSERKGNAEKEATKKKKNKASSMYDVLERFRKLSIIQSTS